VTVAASPSTHVPVRRHRRHPVRAFVRTPKGTLLVILAVLLAVTGRVEGYRLVLPGVLTAASVSGLVDLLVVRWRRRRWVLPDGALLTGVLIGAVLSSYEPLFVPAAAAAVAIVSKHVLRTRATHIFNPAAVGLVLVFHLFDTAQNWWGALQAIVPGAAWPLLLASGVFITIRVNRVPLVLSFLAAYFALFAAATFVVDPAEVSEVFVAPDLLAAMFFALFMLTDPPTSPSRHTPQLVCGVLVATLSVAAFLVGGVADYLLLGLLGGNVFEAARRVRGGR